MCFGLRAIVEAEDPFDDGFEIGGNRERAGAAAVRARAVLIAAQVRAERFVEGLHCAAEFHRPAGGIFADDFQAVLRGEFANFFEIGRRRAVRSRKFFAAKIFSLAGKTCADLGGRRKFAGL